MDGKGLMMNKELESYLDELSDDVRKWLHDPLFLRLNDRSRKEVEAFRDRYLTVEVLPGGSILTFENLSRILMESNFPPISITHLPKDLFIRDKCEEWDDQVMAGLTPNGDIILTHMEGTYVRTHCLLHEYAHFIEYIKHNRDRKKAMRPVNVLIRDSEVTAESAAYIVGRYFNLKHEASSEYVAKNCINSNRLDHNRKITLWMSERIIKIIEKGVRENEKENVGINGTNSFIRAIRSVLRPTT